MKNLVSVLIPAYNHGKYIQETIKSIIKQSYQNIELLVIDDGSSDDTWQKLNELKNICEKRFSRVVFETENNRGTCNTLNKLITLSQGEYIYIIASDDLAKPQAIEKLFNFLSQNPNYALTVGDNEIINSNSQRIFWDENRNSLYEEKEAKYKTFAEFLQHNRKDVDFNSENFGNYPSLAEMNYVPNGYLIRKSIFEKTGMFTQEAPLEDYYLMLQIAKYSKMKYIDKILFSYRWHPTNTIKEAEKMDEFIKQTKNYEKALIKKIDLNNFNPEIQKYLKNGEKSCQAGIPFFFEFYKLKNLFFKKSCLRILGFEINIKNKVIPDF